MEYQEFTIENEYLSATVTTWGAQLKSVVRKCDGVEHMWNADKEVWGYHSPILFPHCGKVVDGIIHAKGQDYPSGQHGFARLMEHKLMEYTTDCVTLELCSSPETLEKFPYEFCLRTSFCLEGDTVVQYVTVENQDDENLPFGLGFHPAFKVPFDDKHTATDYEFRFSEMESPLCLSCIPGGLVRGKCYYLGTNIDSIPLDERLFAMDSHCMTNLNSETLGIYEAGTGRGVEVNISGFPYTLIWSKPGVPKFVCIEPWHSLPSPEGSSTEWTQKPAAAILAPGESWTTSLSMRFVR